MTLLSAAEPVEAVLRRPHGLLEGPRFGADGEMVYSDVIAGGVYACTRAGEVRELLPKRRGVGGIVAHERGGWVLSGRTLVHVLPDGAQRELAAGGGEAAGYNDLGSTPAGELLAGELRYRPLAGEPPREGRLLLLGRHGGTQVLCEEVLWPNGIGVAADGRTVYVSDYARRCVLVTDLGGAPAQVFATMPDGCSADGLALDAEGGVWVALGEGGGVARFRPDGTLEERIDLPASFVSSLCFGGEDGCTVLVSTADNVVAPELGGTLLRARSEVAGLPVYAAGV